jgi:hypothetical protein
MEAIMKRWHPGRDAKTAGIGIKKRKILEKLREKKAGFFLDHAASMLIILVVAVIILVFLNALFKDVIMPGIQEKTQTIYSTT